MFNRFWTRKSRDGNPGAPSPRSRGSRSHPKDVHRQRHPGSPRIRNELAKLGIHLLPTTVAKYMVRRQKPASTTWRTFVDNHVKDLVAVDFFVVPTATFEVLFVFLVLAHDRRRVLHFNVTTNPSAEWTARQIVQASHEKRRRNS